MRTKIITALTLLLFASAAQAGTIQVSVNGLVCSFCATGIEKTFSKQAAVKTVKVDLDNKLVTLTTKPKQDIDDATIKNFITDAGFTVTNIKRTQ